MKRKILSFTFLTAALFCSVNQLSAQNTKYLFKGSDLSNWEFVVENNQLPADQVFSPKEGEIHITGKPFGYMYTKEKYSNYQLHVEWQWMDSVKTNNSGIFLMIEEPKNPFPKGIECQLQAGNAGDFVLLGGANLVEYKDPAGQQRPKFPIIRKTGEASERPFGEWNDANIICRNGSITVYINGVLQNTATSNTYEGYIGLQSEGTGVKFRNIILTTN